MIRRYKTLYCILLVGAALVTTSAAGQENGSLTTAPVGVQEPGSLTSSPVTGDGAGSLTTVPADTGQATGANAAAPGQESDSLAHYLTVAAQNNPGVKADLLTYKASLEKIPQVGAYPDPQLDIGFFPEPMEIIDGRQIADFTLMQMFPWFGTRRAAQTEAEHMANMAFEQFRESRDNLYLQVYTQWFLLCNLRQQLHYSRENKDFLTQLETLALRRFSASSAGSPSSGGRTATMATGSAPAGTGGMGTSGSMGSMGSTGSTGSMGSSMGGASQSSSPGSSMSPMGSGAGMGSSPGMSEVLRIQLEIVELENSIESILSRIDAETAAFNALLNRPSGSKVSLPDSIRQIPFSLDMAMATAQISQHNPMLTMIDEEGAAYRAKAEMDKKMSYPMVGIGLQYSVIGKRMDMGIPVTDMNGMDMIMPMVSISIPIYRSKYKAQQRESNIRWQASRQQYANTQNALQAELYSTKHSLDDASRKIALYDKQSQLALATYRLLIQEFVSGKSDLTEVIQVQRQLLDYRLKKAEATAEYNTMVASIQKLISFNATHDNVLRTIK